MMLTYTLDMLSMERTVMEGMAPGRRAELVNTEMGIGH